MIIAMAFTIGQCPIGFDEPIGTFRFAFGGEAAERTQIVFIDRGYRFINLSIWIEKLAVDKQPPATPYFPTIVDCSIIGEAALDFQ
ncbi:MAG: hypothetical protein LBE89_01700, partial [Helicobacteraceae bacterium]|nr:hypothetical protein [Helicobacteraceae bacterium]